LSEGFFVADAEGNIVSDAFRAHGHVQRYGFEEREPRILYHDYGPPQTRLERGLVLGIQTNTNYFHWLMEALPRLHLAERMNLLEGAKVIVPRLRPWMRSMLEYCSPRAIELHEHIDGPVVCDNLIMPGRGLLNIHTFAEHSIAMVEWMIERFNLGAKPAPKRRLFVSRQRTSSRRISNETALLTLAVRHGFEVIYPEQLTFAEQLEAFAGAEAVAGALGAGLSNAAFMAPGSVLIEFAPEQRGGDCTLFANLAFHRKLGYAAVISPCLASDRPIDRRDFTVDLRLAEEAFVASVAALEN
jgi:capsular polysaccharide biosynthesis protein